MGLWLFGSFAVCCLPTCLRTLDFRQVLISSSNLFLFLYIFLFFRCLHKIKVGICFDVGLVWFNHILFPFLRKSKSVSLFSFRGEKMSRQMTEELGRTEIPWKGF